VKQAYEVLSPKELELVAYWNYVILFLMFVAYIKLLCKITSLNAVSSHLWQPQASLDVVELFVATESPSRGYSDGIPEVRCPIAQFSKLLVCILVRLAVFPCLLRGRVPFPVDTGVGEHGDWYTNETYPNKHEFHGVFRHEQCQFILTPKVEYRK